MDLYFIFDLKGMFSFNLSFPVHKDKPYTHTVHPLVCKRALF